MSRTDKKKVPLSRCLAPDTGWEAIKHSSRGSELYQNRSGIKNTNGQLANFRRLYQMLDAAKIRIILKPPNILV